jgi:hypothetical protein
MPHKLSNKNAYTEMRAAVERARREALLKHGSLQGGMLRWRHHLREECDEAVFEMMDLHAKFQHPDSYYHPRVTNGTRIRLFEELAQVAQLAESMMMMLINGDERLGEGTWQEKSSSCKAASGGVKPKGLSLINSLSKEE